MTNYNTYKLKIKNVKYDGMSEFLEELCESEKIKIAEEYQDSYSFLNDKSGSWFTMNSVNKDNDYVLESYSLEKLKYIEYLYNKRKEINNNLEELMYINNNDFIQDNKKEHVVGEIKVGIDNDKIKSHIESYLSNFFKEIYIAEKYKNSRIYLDEDTRKSLESQGWRFEDGILKMDMNIGIQPECSIQNIHVDLLYKEEKKKTFLEKIRNFINSIIDS